MACRPVSLVTAAIVCLAAVSVSAQDAPAQASSAPPAHISFVDGAAVLERDGRPDSELLSMPLLAGDRLRTQGGRVEVLFADGSALHLDANTVVDFQSDEVVRLLDGRIRLTIAGGSRDVSYRIDAPSAWVQISVPGEYRVAILRNADVELAVLRGAAELVNEAGRSYIRAGERTFAREGSAPTAPYVYNSAAWDSFDRWSEERRDQRLGTSAQYLPNDVRPYAASFDTYGSWRHEPTYGHVWYPRVYAGWRPYYRGRWVSLRPYGWTWVAHDPWGWPTHHYGRWGFSAGAWFWIPGRHWGPAWVSWAYAGNYVSWCPLGWNNRPVIQIVNVYGGRHYSPWHAWTVVPRRHFGGTYVNVAHIGSTRVDQRIHNTFVVGNSAPDARLAVGRSAAPIRTAGRYAVPRNGGGTFATESLPARAAGRSPDATAINNERRFPAPSRAPRTPSATQPANAAPVGGRAVSRERSADNASVAPRVAPPSETGRSEPREFRRTPDAGISRGADDRASDRGVSAAPAGAVRAMPRARERSEAAPIGANGNVYGRSRTGDSQPVYSSPAPSVAPARPMEDGRARANPGYRAAPEGGDARGRAMPRTEPSAPPAYRAAPEQRRGPSAPPPAASAPEPRSSGEGGRARSGDTQSSGQARRRR